MNGQPPGGGQVQDEVGRVLGGALLAIHAVLSEQEGRWEVQGDPTEGALALIVAGHKLAAAAGQVEERFVRIGEVPFSSERERRSTVHSDAERPVQLTLFSAAALVQQVLNIAGTQRKRWYSRTAC